MLRYLSLGCLVLVAILAGAAEAAERLKLSAKRLHQDADKVAPTRNGKLVWRGGLVLDSSDRNFGGLSGLLVAADGERFTAVTDQGNWISAKLKYDSDGWLDGIKKGRIGALDNPKGKNLKDKFEQDAESLARLGDGSLLVGFEHAHRIWRYPPNHKGLSGKAEELETPRLVSELPANKGIEALVSLGEGGLLAITQGRDKDRDIAAFLLWDGRWVRLSYPKHGKFKPTGAALLPSGNVIVLERRYTSLADLAARLVVIDAAEIRPGAALETREIAVLDRLALIDNMEGVAARSSAEGETLIYLVSDDNFHPLQRTLLLMFALVE